MANKKNRVTKEDLNISESQNAVDKKIKGKKEYVEVVNAFVKGKTNKIKWTEEKVYKFFQDILEMVLEDEKITNISMLTNRLLVTKSMISYLKNKFPANEDIKNLIEFIYEILEARLYQKGLSNKFNAYLVAFGLRVYHNKIEKTKVETDNKHSGTIEIEIKDSTSRGYRYKHLENL